jgi:hypothetical protein
MKLRSLFLLFALAFGTSNFPAVAQNNLVFGNAYGMVGDDGTTNNDTPFANALAAVPTNGGAVAVMPGRYSFNNGVSSTKESVHLVCLAGSGWSPATNGTQGNMPKGCVFETSTAGTVILTLGDGATTLPQRMGDR